MRQARDDSSLEAGQSQEQKGSHSGSTKKREQCPLCISDGPNSSQKLGIGINIQKYTGRVVLRGYIVKEDSGACGVFTDHGSSASQMAAAKVVDVIVRLPDCDGPAADAISASTPVKLEDAPELLRIPKSECPDMWTRTPRHKLPKSWSRSSGSSRTKSVRTPTCGTLMGETVRGSSVGTQMVESTELGMLICSQETRFVLICTRG